MKFKLRSAAATWLALVMMIGSVMGSSGKVSAADTAMTVAQAIANNTGTATVEGYVVAHTTGNKAYDFEAPFANDFNLAIADSPAERDTAKLLPVQLPSALRGQFGLLTNPLNIGKKVRITGDLLAYFTVPGLKNPTAAVFVSGGGEPDPGPIAASIGDARAKIGQSVIVQGVVTADNAAIGGANLSTYIQDDTAGINVFSFDRAQFPDLKEGDAVKVTGTISVYKGLTEIVPAAGGIEVTASGQALPAPKPMTIQDLSDPAKAEAVEGQLIRLTGYAQSVPGTPAGGGYNIALIDAAFHGTTLRLMEAVNAISSVQQGTWYDVTGVASQYDGYQLLPRKAADIARLDPQPTRPDASGAYTSTVTSIVDGDTIHLSTPVLGTTTVRFVNIDTPETYHTPVTGADANQKRLGEAAKAYLNTLLKAGDEVELIVGQEPTDDYGRLLAQVVRKSDGMNVNLEMVKTGQAVTYFIWPIDGDYEAYSAAVRGAQQAKLGIWNDSDPLMELPFVFRAREQQKGLTRYVGDFYHKTYVQPDKWSEVPVDARVFFASAAEAESNGYAAKGNKVSVQLLGVNDLHGKIDQTAVSAASPGKTFGRADYLAAYLREREATNPNTLIMHSGDMIGGSSPVSALLQDEPTVEIMESIGFDVGTLGNHEFDEGAAELLRMIKGGEHPNGTPGYDGMNFPVVAANVEYKDTGELLLDPYAVKQIGGVKIGFIGVVTTETPNIVMPSGITNIRFTDEAEAINKYVPELQAQGVEAIVVLAHVPGVQSGDTATGEIASLANKVNDAVDIIYAAHNHVKLNAVVDGKLIVQAWEYGDAFVDIDMEIDAATGDIVSKSAEIVDVVQQNMQPDAAVAAILEKYAQSVAPKVNAVVGTNAAFMPKGYPTKDVFGDIALGNFIADGMAYAMNADAALMNGGGVRDNLSAGQVTWGQLFNVQPFGNTLVKVDVTGAQLTEILNAMINPRFGPDSFIGGMRYTWSTATGKVVNLMLADGTPVDPAAVYSLVVNNFMYNQTTGKYALIGKYGKNVVQGPEDIEATVAFAKSFGAAPIDYTAEGRISTDITAPVTTPKVEGPKVSFSASDDAAGVLYTEYRVDGGSWHKGMEADVTGPSGKHMVEFRSVDKVYNREQPQSVELVVDNEGPVIEAAGLLAYFHYEKVELHITATDEWTGVASVQVALDGKPAGTDIMASPFELTTGSHTIVVHAVDHAGNASEQTFTLSVNMDLQHLDELLDAGYNNGDVESSVYNGLRQQIETAQRTQNAKARDALLSAVQSHVNELSGKKIDESFAKIMDSDLKYVGVQQ